MHFHVLPLVQSYSTQWANLPIVVDQGQILTVAHAVLPLAKEINLINVRAVVILRDALCFPQVRHVLQNVGECLAEAVKLPTTL
jgi:hypothetical protein